MPDLSLADLTYSSATETLVRYWMALPRQNSEHAPRFADLDMAALHTIEDELFLSEWYSDDVLTILQSGIQLQRWLGIDLKGHNILALFSEETAQEEKKYFRTVRDTPCAGMLTRAGFDVAGVPIHYRTLQLPLGDASGRIRYFIGTGAALDGTRDEVPPESTHFTSVKDTERLYFDIGAGLSV